MSMLVRRLLVLLAVAGAGFVPAPATAAGYCAGSGVNVVVDFGSLGGGVEKGCGSGSTAAAVFGSAGISLTRDQQYPGVVCKVEGLPGNANCATMPAGDAYWGLYWSDGTSGRWVYASTGVDGVKVPDGGFVAFAWQSSTSQRTPSAAPSNPKPTPSPTKAPSKAPTKAATHQATASAMTRASATPQVGASSAVPSQAPSAVSGATTSAAPSASATAPTAAPSAPTTDASPSAGPTSATAAGPIESRNAADQGGGGLPGWVPVVVLVLLAAGGGGATWWRRRASG